MRVSDGAVCHGDIDGRDVIREQENFIGEDLMFIFVGEFVRRDQPELQQPHNEGASARERVEDRDIVRGHAARDPEFVFQGPVRAVENEVDNLLRRVDDPEPLSRPRKRNLKEALVYLPDESLFALVVGDLRDLSALSFVERFERLSFAPKSHRHEQPESLFERLRDGVIFREVVETCVEYRLGDVMLREHVDSLVGFDVLVDVVAQPFEVLPENLVDGIAASVYDLLNALAVSVGNVLHLGCPLRCIFAIPALLDKSDIDSSAPVSQPRRYCDRPIVITVG